MFVLLALHLLAAVASPLAGRRLGARVLWLAGVAPLATTVWAAVQAPAVLGGTPVVEHVTWVGGLGLDLALRLDAFALLMVMLVSGIGTLVFAYASVYFDEHEALGRFAGMLAGFAGAMLGLVLTDNVLALIVFWELTAVTSYLLIGFENLRPAARGAALQALLVTGSGGLAMLGGLVLLGQQAGTFSLSGILAARPSGGMVEVALVLVLLGAFTKSAQVPFHTWLPAAMAAPTPVSAYLHSATMVKAGVYLVARMAPAFAGAAVWRPLVIGVGLTTMVLGGVRALRRHDLKLLLADGTVSQLGFMMVLFGTGDHAATLAGATLLLAHGLFKAALFMITGVVDHQAGTRDLRRLNGLHRALRPALIVAAVAAASMAGLPPLLGFIAKEGAYEAFTHGVLGAWTSVVLAGLVGGSILTVAYSARFVWGAFASKRPGEARADAVGPEVPAAGTAIVGPAALLSAITVVAGLAPRLVSDLVVGGARTLDPAVPDTALALWHGVNPALLLSALTIAAGAGVFAIRRRAERFRTAPVTSERTAGGMYRAGLRGLVVVSDSVTGALQSGSLPAYLAIILLTVLVLPGTALLRTAIRPDRVVAFDHPAQIGVAAVIAASALAVTVSRHRFTGVLTLGGVGYGVAGLFVLHGAPDLAVTQLLVETLVIVLFVLVLRHLPKEFPRHHLTLSQAPRVLLAAGIGVFVTAATLVTGSARTAPSVSREHVRQALPAADGQNVVNVILVDFRAFDTMGEIVVLTVATLGILGLVRAVRRDQQRSSGEFAIIGAERVIPSVVLETVAQLTFRTILLFSMFLLFAGHNAPGGGFIGGLVAGTAFVLLYVGRGAEGLRRAEPFAPEVLMGAGVTLATVTAVGGWLWGTDLLDSGKIEVALPLFGPVKLLSTLPFDIGVYLVVVGLVIGLLRSLGREEMSSP